MTHHVKEILPDGLNVIDDEGDVLPRHDFTRDEYPEPSFEEIERDRLSAVAMLIDRARKLHVLARRQSDDPETKKNGGVKACKKTAHDSELLARKTFLELYGYPVTLSDSPTDAEHDAYYSGQGKWTAFRNTLASEESRVEFMHSLKKS